MYKSHKYTKRVLHLQCLMIGVNHKKVDGHKERWFMDHSWSKRTEKLFVLILTVYLRLSKGARRELLNSFYYVSWERCNKAAKEWAWNFGWRYDERDS